MSNYTVWRLISGSVADRGISEYQSANTVTFELFVFCGLSPPTARTDLTLMRGVFVRSNRLCNKEWDMDFLQANIRVQGDSAPVVLRSQKLAMICIIVAWLAGTCLFESLSWGEESCAHSQVTSDHLTSKCSLTLGDQWRDLETEISLASSGIDSFVRLEENRYIRLLLTKMIRNEEAILAMRQSTQSLCKAPKHLSVDPDAIVVDPIIGSMHIAKGDVTNAYRELDESRQSLLLTERSNNRLAWDDAQMSALPGLIRLVAVDVGDLMSPVYIRQMKVDNADHPDAASSEDARPDPNPPPSPTAATSDDPSVSHDPIDEIPPAKVIRQRPNILTVAESITGRPDVQPLRTDPQTRTRQPPSGEEGFRNDHRLVRRVRDHNHNHNHNHERVRDAAGCRNGCTRDRGHWPTGCDPAARADSHRCR